MASTPNNPTSGTQTTSPSSRKKGKNNLWLILLACLLFAGALIGFTVIKPGKTETAPVATTPVVRGDIEKIVAATGKVEANFEVEIKAKASGKIIRLPYDVSDYVSQGALLVQLDPIDENRAVSQASASLSGLESKASQSRINLNVAQRTLETDIAKAKADLSAAQAKYKDASTKSNRLRTLVQSRYISQEEYETGLTTTSQADTDLKNAQTRLRELQTQKVALQAQAEDVEYTAAQAEAQRVALASSEQRLAETKIYAPIAGVVTTRLGQIGQIVSSGISNVGGGTAIMTIADLSHIYVLASVDESDIGQVREGQPVNITADAFPGEKFQGKVVRIAPKGLEESNVVTFEVKIEVTGPNNKLLKPAMTTNVEIITAHRDNVLKLPAEAVNTGRKGNSFVLISQPEQKQPARKRITVGLNNGTDVEILQGLTEGQQIVLNQGQARSRWRKNASDTSQSQAGNTRRGQMMMMRGMGGGGRR